ncbi:MAG: hypothetical protein AAFQ63_09075 [Cyanobacteria bacterium J06621_11]
MDWDDVWLLPSGSNLDFNVSDWRKEAEAAFQRQTDADRFFKGLRQGTVTPGDCDAFFDHLAEDGIEPYDYLDAVVENIELVMADGRPINTDGLGLSRQIIT